MRNSRSDGAVSVSVAVRGIDTRGDEWSRWSRRRVSVLQSYCRTVVLLSYQQGPKCSLRVRSVLVCFIVCLRGQSASGIDK